MAKWYIDYGTVNEWVEGDLEDAMYVAQENAEYTQQDIWITRKRRMDEVYGDGRKPNAVLSWIPLKPEPEEPVSVRFGDIGYYGEWVVWDEIFYDCYIHVLPLKEN